VTARKADINQWHFAHRTDIPNTASECEFSPVTAIALILRQQLPRLQSFDLDIWSFDEVSWEIDTHIDGVRVDAFTQNPKDSTSLAIEIPFAVDKGVEIEQLVSVADIVLSIDTHLMVRDLFKSNDKVTLYRPEEILDLLLTNWNQWVTIEFPDLPEPEPGTISTLEENDSICVSCNDYPGSYGRGLLCAGCVRQQVGVKFPNLTEMIDFYKKSL
jgi:hypothetical protein